MRILDKLLRLIDVSYKYVHFVMGVLRTFLCRNICNSKHVCKIVFFSMVRIIPCEPLRTSKENVGDLDTIHVANNIMRTTTTFSGSQIWMFKVCRMAKEYKPNFLRTKICHKIYTELTTKQNFISFRLN